MALLPFAWLLNVICPPGGVKKRRGLGRYEQNRNHVPAQPHKGGEYQAGRNAPETDHPRHVQCTQYNPLMAGTDSGWLFSSQICAIVATVCAVLAGLFALTGINKNPTQAFLLLAAGTQIAAVLASIGWCHRFVHCAMLRGGSANVMAAILYSTAWAYGARP